MEPLVSANDQPMRRIFEEGPLSAAIGKRRTQLGFQGGAERTLTPDRLQPRAAQRVLDNPPHHGGVVRDP